MSPTRPHSRRFVVERFSDPTEASGLGIVLDGILWPDGTVSVRWRGDDPSFVSWPSIDAAERKHCYGGLSRIVWIDPAPEPPATAPAGKAAELAEPPAASTLPGAVEPTIPGVG